MKEHWNFEEIQDYSNFPIGDEYRLAQAPTNELADEHRRPNG